MSYDDDDVTNVGGTSRDYDAATPVLVAAKTSTSTPAVSATVGTTHR